MTEEARVAGTTASAVELASASQFVDGVSDRMDHGLKELLREAESVLSQSWQGQAQKAYQTAFDQWCEGAREVIGGLVVASQMLAANGQAYSATEQQNTDNLGGIGGALNIQY